MSRPDRPRRPVTDRPAIRVGLLAWSALGLAGVVVVAWTLATRLALVTVPMLLALFPAALLAPVVGWLHRHRWPRALATTAVVLVAVALLGGLLALVVPRVAAQVPALAATLDRAGARLDQLLEPMPGTDPDAGPGNLLRRAVLDLMGGYNSVIATTLTWVSTLVFGLILVIVLVFCYLSGGHRIPTTALSLLPHRHRGPAHDLAHAIWETLGAYVRALFLVALFDATLMGLGLWLLGVPLVLPLAVLVFFGAFVPYIGAFASGLAAVLVAFADGGPGSALAVLVLIVVVQQVDGNIVQPLIMGRVIALSAFTVIVSVSAGAALLGVLGAFLAVPVAAAVARAIAFARDHDRLPDGDG